MKIKYKHSIKARVDRHILEAGDSIDWIAMSRDEYIAFLEEITSTERILLSLPERKYKGVQINIDYGATI